MNLPPSTYYAVLLALVLGVGSEPSRKMIDGCLSL